MPSSFDDNALMSLALMIAGTTPRTLNVRCRGWKGRIDSESRDDNITLNLNMADGLGSDP
jgi:hypothetical protein